MQLRDIINFIWGRLSLVLFCTAASICVAWLATAQMRPTYTATSGVRISLNAGQAVDYGSLVYAERLVNTYAKLVVSTPVLAQLQQRLGLGVSIAQLQEQISIDSSANSELLHIRAQSEDPVLAASIANTLAEILIETSRSSRSGRGYPVSIVDPAIAPSRPSAPRLPLNLALAAATGLLGGMILAIFLESLSPKLYIAENIEAITGKLPLGRIPTIRRGQLRAFHGNGKAEGEAFRQLRTSLLELARHSSARTFLITSPEPGDGKTTIALHLAAVLAQAGRLVVLVDGDMRLPKLHRLLKTANTAGLSTVLREEQPLDKAIQPTCVEGLCLLSSGPLPSNPAELLVSPQLHLLFKELRERFEFVLWDSPALLAVADARIVLPEIDTALLVAERGGTRVEIFKTAWRYLCEGSHKPIDVVFNRAKPEGSYGYYRRLRRASQRGIDHA